MVVLDTNILIDHLRRSEKEDSVFKRLVKENPQEIFSISIIAVQELYGGKSTRNESEEMRMLSLVDQCELIAYTYEIAKLAGKIEREHGSVVEFPDAAIAATAIVNDAKLFTLNKKDFVKISKLKLY